MDKLIELLTNPVTWTILGILAAKFAPSWVPILGTGRKLVNELVELHGRSTTANSRIVADAESAKLKKAAEVLTKRLET